MKGTALVTGATGMVGPALVDELNRSGYSVRALVRDESKVSVLHPKTEVFIGDLNDPESIRMAVGNVDTVFHLAAKLHINNPTEDLYGDYEEVNVGGTRLLAEASTVAGVKRFIYFSTINVYGTGGSGTVYSESDAPQPDSIYSKTKFEGEQVALALHDNTTVLRLGAVYGPNIKGNYQSLVRILKMGFPVILGDGSNKRTLIYVSDAAKAAVAIAGCEGNLSQVYNVTDGRFHSLNDIVRSIQLALGKRDFAIHIPAGMVRAPLVLLHKIAKVAGTNPPITPYLVDKFTESFSVSGDKLQMDLDWTPSTHLDDGWKAVVSDLSE